MAKNKSEIKTTDAKKGHISNVRTSETNGKKSSGSALSQVGKNGSSAEAASGGTSSKSSSSGLKRNPAMSESDRLTLRASKLAYENRDKRLG